MSYLSPEGLSEEEVMELEMQMEAMEEWHDEVMKKQAEYEKWMDENVLPEFFQ